MKKRLKSLSCLLSKKFKFLKIIKFLKNLIAKWSMKLSSLLISSSQKMVSLLKSILFPPLSVTTCLCCRSIPSPSMLTRTTSPSTMLPLPGPPTPSNFKKWIIKLGTLRSKLTWELTSPQKSSKKSIPDPFVKIFRGLLSSWWTRAQLSTTISASSLAIMPWRRIPSLGFCSLSSRLLQREANIQILRIESILLWRSSILTKIHRCTSVAFYQMSINQAKSIIIDESL